MLRAACLKGFMSRQFAGSFIVLGFQLKHTKKSVISLQESQFLRSLKLLYLKGRYVSPAYFCPGPYTLTIGGMMRVGVGSERRAMDT